MVLPGSGFQVHPDELSAAATAADGTAARLPDQGRLLAAATDRSADGLSGWRTAAALRSCGNAWHALLGRLNAELADQGRKLDSTAQRYRAGELSATDAFLAPAVHPHALGPPPAFGREAPPYTTPVGP
ncbi:MULTISPECIES: type VII secretion target [Kitasatospora]|uniref:type VII secretion target n=1 Tax=Kitasatospora TaxID=2063 RepID=UPI000CC1B93B|nr:type VII secretion target [Kitasatospora sp. GP30]MDH6144255.1 uncharacterized protein YukE [Kitasatospora sp. GP30]